MGHSVQYSVVYRKHQATSKTKALIISEREKMRGRLREMESDREREILRDGEGERKTKCGKAHKEKKIYINEQPSRMR